jgi:hypothetical protein
MNVSLYPFTSVRGGPRNPSRPPLSKGGDIFPPLKKGRCEKIKPMGKITYLVVPWTG